MHKPTREQSTSQKREGGSGGVWRREQSGREEGKSMIDLVHWLCYCPVWGLRNHMNSQLSVTMETVLTLQLPERVLGMLRGPQTTL